MDMFSKGVKREVPGRPTKARPEKRDAYDAGKKAAARRQDAERDQAAAKDQPDTRFSNGVLRRRVGRR